MTSYLPWRLGRRRQQNLEESTAASVQQVAESHDDKRESIMAAWAFRELAPWLTNPVEPARAELLYTALHETEESAFVFDFAAGNVELRPKRRSQDGREQHYLRLFKSVLPSLPPNFAATLCVGLADKLMSQYDAPVFCFQKKAGEKSILLPDIDFLLGDFHRGSIYTDRFQFNEKSPTAVFAGGTTGGSITPEEARALTLPRLRAARYFENSKTVDFRLASISQCTSPEAERILKTYAFCRKSKLTWQAQFRHRFLISMDGNGATCSRVAVALHSNSVLMKYASDHNLYYFGGLQPWLHYVPITDDRDVENIIALEAYVPELFKTIAQQGRIFAETFLTRESVLRYTALLLQQYKGAFIGRETPPPAIDTLHTRGRTATVDLTTIKVHVAGVGDQSGRVGEWLGKPGSRSAIEGVAIFLSPDMPAEGFSYQVVLEDGTLSVVAHNEEYCGTTGLGVKIFGLLINCEGAFSRLFDVTYDAAFLDGSKIEAVPAGQICKAASYSALEALRISILAK